MANAYSCSSFWSNCWPPYINVQSKNELLQPKNPAETKLRSLSGFHETK